jgi:hypothetical protein
MFERIACFIYDFVGTVERWVRERVRVFKTGAWFSVPWDGK